MKHAPEIQWLIDRWGLPSEGPAIEKVNALRVAEQNGSTALWLPGDLSIDWGQAASDPTHPHTPLILTKTPSGSFLQSLKCFRAEETVAQRLHTFTDPEKNKERTLLKNIAESQLLEKLFPHAEKGNAQVKAVQTALHHRLTILTGGPGTGKTHTLARILVALSLAEPSLGMIRLAAPTGKAADRIKQTILTSLNFEASHGIFDSIHSNLQQIAKESRTLHALLGYHFQTGRCRHHPKNPLPCKVLIVDECSMIDIHLWKSLLLALPEDARLILVGDPFQLQSVDQGNVFGDIVAHAKEASSFLHPSLVQLTHSWRFRERPDISALASALENSDTQGVTNLLSRVKNHADKGLAWLETDGRTLSYPDYPQPIRIAMETVAKANTPEEALDALKKVCILTANKGAFVGAEAVSNLITREMRKQHATPPFNEPILVRENDPETGLRNGSVGVIHTDKEGNRRAWFGENETQYHSFALGSLPSTMSAWAITIHRSQGSEYDNVLVFLPREGSPLNSRELLYTAITRARKNVIIVGSLDVILEAVKATSQRTTLLKHAL